MDRKEHRAIVAARKDRSDHFDSSDGGGLTGKIDVRSSFVLSENSMKRQGGGTMAKFKGQDGFCRPAGLGFRGDETVLSREGETVPRLSNGWLKNCQGQKKLLPRARGFRLKYLTKEKTLLSRWLLKWQWVYENRAALGRLESPGKLYNRSDVFDLVPRPVDKRDSLIAGEGKRNSVTKWIQHNLTVKKK